MKRQHTLTRRPRSTSQLVLALLLLAMAAGQLANFPGFVDVLRDYDIGAGALAWSVALALVLGEAAGGLLLLSGSPSRRTFGAAAALAVAILWSGLATAAFAQGEAVPNCGCFGVYLAQPLRWWVLLEDAEFVALGAWVLSRERGSESQGRLRELGLPKPGSEADVRASQAH